MARKLEHKAFHLKYRPKNIEDYVCNEKMENFIKGILAGKDFQPLLLSGVAGTGKTTLALMIAERLEADYLFINGSKDNSIDIVRTKIENFCGSRTAFMSKYKYKIVIIDEMEGLSDSAQKALKTDTEKFETNTRFIFTTNNPHKIIPPIRDRFKFIEMGKDFSKQTKKKYFKRIVNIMKKEGIKYSGDRKNMIKVLLRDYPSFRKPLNLIQFEASANDGFIDFDKLVNIKEVDDEFLEKVIELIKKEDVMGCHKIAFEYGNNINLDSFYMGLMERILEYCDDDTNEIMEIGKFISDKYAESYITNVKEITIAGTLFGIIYLKGEE